MLNKFAASCEKCAKRVAPGDGELRGEPSNWFTVCKDCSVKSKSVLRLDLYRSDDSLEIGNVIIDASSVGDLAFFKVKSAMQKSRVRRIGKNTKVFFCSVEELPDVVKALQTEDCEFVVTAAVRAAIEEHIQESEERLEIAKMHLEIMEKQLGPYWEKVGQRISGVPWKLRSYQRDGVIYLRSNPDGFLADDVGVGKTPTLLVSIPQNMGILIVAPRNAKSVWVDHINWWRPDLKCTMLKGKSGFRWPEPNEAVITTYDSLPDFVPNDETYEHLSMSQKTTPSDWWIGVDEKLRDMPEDIILIADECFTYDTLIDTEIGQVKIGDIVKGNLDLKVKSANLETNDIEYRKILKHLRKPLPERMVKIKHENGTFICTESHKIWTDRGYVKAGNLSNVDYLWTMRPGESLTWKSLQAEILFVNMLLDRHKIKEDINVQELWGRFLQPIQTKSVLFEVVRRQISALTQSYCRKPFENVKIETAFTYENKAWPGNKKNAFGKNETLQSNERRSCSKENIRNEQRKNVPLAGKKSTPERSAKTALPETWMALWSPSERMDGVYNQNEISKEKIQIAANLLQSGFSESIQKNSDRSRWSVSQLSQAKRGSFEISRVVSTEIIEQGSYERYGIFGEEGSFVYDLEVEDNHNYFANGVLVSNCHKVKSGKTSRHRKFKALSNMIQSVGGYIWPASGSPMQNNPDELWTILSVLGLAKKAYGSRTYFNEIFKDYYAGKRGEELKVPIEAVEGFRRVALRRNLSDVVTELPGKIWNSILVEDIDKETRRVLDDAWAYIGPILDKMKKEEAVNWLQKLMRSKEGQAYEHFMRARQALAIAKIPQMLELVEDMEENGEPVIIYSYHRAPIEVLEDRPGWAIITGNVSESRRAHIVRDFREGKLKGIGITVTSGSEAITLVKAGNKPAHNAIFVDLAFNPMVNEQAEGRLNRLGQTEVVIITRMVADHPIDARVMDILTTKSSVIHQTINAAAVKELPDRITPFKALLTLQVIGKKPANPRRNAQTPLEKWAKEGLSKVKQFLSMDADAGPKFVSLMKSGGLTERQWAYAIDICKRYPKDVGVYVAPTEPVEEAGLDG